MPSILMCGPFALSGGVSTHTKNISENLKKIGNDLVLYNLSGREIEDLEQDPIRKIHQRTFGLIFKAIIIRENFDIIHIQASGGIFSFIAAITGCFVSNILNKKCIITFHYSQTEKFVKKYEKLFGIVLRYTDKLILVSNTQKQIFLVKFPQFSEKITVIPNGYVSNFYPLNKELCRTKLGLPLNKKIIINISNLITTKGHKYLVESIKEILEYRNDVICIIIGKGPLKDELINQINTLGLKDYIKVVGWKQDEELPFWINSCDIFVLPSLNESFGIVQIEAMACGKPVVATYNGGSESVIISEDYGLLCKPANSNDLAEKLLVALDAKWNYDKIIRYSKNFTWENVAKETTQIYENTLKHYD